jgi:hypothetical protein
MKDSAEMLDDILYEFIPEDFQEENATNHST